MYENVVIKLALPSTANALLLCSQCLLGQMLDANSANNCIIKALVFLHKQLSSICDEKQTLSTEHSSVSTHVQTFSWAK